MSSTATNSASRQDLKTFDTVYAHILQKCPPPLLPPGHSSFPKLTSIISALSLHPALEAGLHLLNNDLPNAHFLCRQMQAPPAYEGMYLHGILHRIEGDYDNARAWYGNISNSDVFKDRWNSEEEGLDFIGKVEKLRKKKEGDKQTLEKESLREIKGVVDWCVNKFGKEAWMDARSEYTQPDDEEHKKMARDMVSGGEGFRKF
ncbi:hypothetical protein MMC25_000740 [Agyrium rufum]|nr:hypothetical protein [Agyrium rufum]